MTCSFPTRTVTDANGAYLTFTVSHNRVQESTSKEHRPLYCERSQPTNRVYHTIGNVSSPAKFVSWQDI